MSVKAKIEAVLFLTDKPIHAAAIARIVNEDVQIVRQTLLELIHDYEERAGGLEIAQDNGYMIQVKDELSSIIEEFLPMEMSAALLRTLSAIAIKQPVMQSEIVRVRGAGAYDHIKELLLKELIAKKEEGRSPILTTTKKFQEYFRLTRDAKSLRQDIKKQDAQKLAAAEAAGQLELPLPAEASTEDAVTGNDTSAQYDAAIAKLLDTAIAVAEDESSSVQQTTPETSVAVKPISEDLSGSDTEGGSIIDSATSGGSALSSEGNNGISGKPGAMEALSPPNGTFSETAS
jgi:segregation and condensation protein B